MKALLIMIFIISGCGGAETVCRTQEEMVFSCQAEEISKHGNQPWIQGYCEGLYPVQSCW